jgi:gamma-glutamylcyclotransferase (GGCT)/AIG2-like uncharacterized protein YtfP
MGAATVNLFVYGSLRAGGANAQAFGAAHRQTAVLWGYAIFEYGTWYPVLLESTGHHVIGEVLSVDPDDPTFQAIDEMEHGAGYERRTLEVHVLHHDDGRGESALSREQAEVYVYGYPDDDRIGGFIPSGDWITHETMRAAHS